MAVSGIQTLGNLTYETWAKYVEEYIRAAQFERVYDAFSMDNVVPEASMGDLFRSSSINLEFLSDLEPGTTTIPETLDVSATAQRDASFQITPTSRFGLIEASEALMNQAGTNYGMERMYALGKHHAMTLDLIANNKANQGGSVHRSAARTSLDAGTAGDLFTATKVDNMEANLLDKQVPGFFDAGRLVWFIIAHPFAFTDLRASTPIVQTAEYQRANIIFKHELGELGKFKLIITPNAKMFYGGGAANGSAIETTLSGSVNALAKTVVVASAANIDVGDFIMIGTHETGDTHYETNERVQVISVASTTIGVSGGGANGGLRYDHASGVAVSNDDSVASIVAGGPRSLAKVYDPITGEFGEVLPPEKIGSLKHISQMGWKWYGNYERWNESFLYREECAVSADA